MKHPEDYKQLLQLKGKSIKTVEDMKQIMHLECVMNRTKPKAQPKRMPVDWLPRMIPALQKSLMLSNLNEELRRM